MQPAWIIQKSIWTLNLVGSALVLWRLYSIGLLKIYPYFSASMALALLRSAALFPFPPTGKGAYYHIWLATQPLIWLSYLLVVVELYSMVLRRYRGILSLSRWFFFGAVAVSAIVSALTVLPTLEKASSTAQAVGRPAILSVYALIERGIHTVLGLMLLLLMVLVSWFPVPLSRNLLTHCSVYSAYFFACNVIVLYWNLGSGRDAVYWSSISRLAIGLACFGCWVFLLSLRGEDRIASMRLGRSPVNEKRLLGQLENLNATLLRTARK